MTYVQNPNYRGALKFFRLAGHCANLDISKIDQLIYLDEIGILDIPKIYERWCLLMIIQVLCEHYDFIPSEEDKEDLFDALVREWRSDKMCSILLKNKNLGRDILLEYEPTLPNGRKPDFVLKVINRSKSDSKKNADQPDEEKLILDAKCKQFIPIGTKDVGANLTDELQELLVNRGYDEDKNNRVFVIHPGFDSNSNNEWENFCRYGGNHFTSDPENRPDWDLDDPDHKHGAVLLRPGQIDRLIRLITMFLYIGLDNTLGRYNKKPPRYDPVCPACGCGCSKVTQKPHRDSYIKGKNVSYSCVNPDCQHLIVRNYCWNCGTHLWKLGGYWTFHKTRSLNPYDIQCPHCGNFLIRERV